MKLPWMFHVKSTCEMVTNTTSPWSGNFAAMVTIIIDNIWDPWALLKCTSAPQGYDTGFGVLWDPFPAQDRVPLPPNPPVQAIQHLSFGSKESPEPRLQKQTKLHTFPQHASWQQGTHTGLGVTGCNGSPGRCCHGCLTAGTEGVPFPSTMG
jgi:hypothetical protein